MDADKIASRYLDLQIELFKSSLEHRRASQQADEARSLSDRKRSLLNGAIVKYSSDPSGSQLSAKQIADMAQACARAEKVHVKAEGRENQARQVVADLETQIRTVWADLLSAVPD